MVTEIRRHGSGDGPGRKLRKSPGASAVVAGPRQVGKTTFVRQALASWPAGRRIGGSTASVRTTLACNGKGPAAVQWETARPGRRGAGRKKPCSCSTRCRSPGLTQGGQAVGDEDTAADDLRVVVLGLAPVDRPGDRELAGRFETDAAGHRRYSEMRAAFGHFSWEQHVFHGGYPGAAVGGDARWVGYVRDALIETTPSRRDAADGAGAEARTLLRRLFDLACRYSGQWVLS